MTEPSPDLVRAVRKGCAKTFDAPCGYPICAAPSDGMYWCQRAAPFLRAALAELAEPSAEMITAGERMRRHLDNEPHPMEINDAGSIWRAMMRKAVGEENG